MSGRRSNIIASVSTRVTSKPRYKSVLSQYTADTKALVGRATNLVRNTAVQSIQQGSKSGVVYEKYNPRRTHTASAAGQPPATDTGFLVNNIALKIESPILSISRDSL